MATSYLILLPFLPEEADESITDWLRNKPVQFRISPKRHSKLGDYRPAHKGKPHRISLNGDMNPYLFLLTLAHELAHYQVWDQGNKQKPHGQAWKKAYKELLNSLLLRPIFPNPLKHKLKRHIARPPASCGLDLELSRALKQYDTESAAVIYLEDVPEDKLFEITGGRIFKKGVKLRKRFRCQEISTKRIYLFQPGTEVLSVSLSA